jgi:hypothetical protein
MRALTAAAAIAVAGAIVALVPLHANPTAAVVERTAPAFPAWPPNQTAPGEPGRASPLPTGQHLSTADALCIACLRLRVGRPLVVRGPFQDELDSPFVALQLKDGSFRGFSANAVTYAIDGEAVWQMGHERRAVMQPGPRGGPDECGRWITAVTRADDKAFALVHQERACNYDIGQTEKSVALASSPDEGRTWIDEGEVISGRDAPKAGAITGEGDCSLVDGRDGYLYAYCLRDSDWQTIVARAPVSDFGPGAWRKFNAGAWSQDALGGDATPIGFFGTASAYLKGIERVATVANDRWFGGLRLALSSDKVHFANLDAPLIPVDDADWQRPADSDLIAYISLINTDDGTNALGSNFLLSYVYLPPGGTFASRYLVFQGVHWSLENTPQQAQVGVALTRWTKPGETTTSSGPVVGDGFLSETFLGYLLTRRPSGAESVELEECIAGEPGHRDHLLTVAGTCKSAGYKHLRTAGWAYRDAVADTMPLYGCRTAAAGGHFASNSADCDGEGIMEFRLGFTLRD